MKQKNNEFLTCFNWINTGQLMKEYSLNKGHLIVFTLILALLEYNDIISKYDVKQANRINPNTTNSNILYLEKIGLLTSKRSNQFFSRSYISITPKGLLLKSQLKKVLNSPLGIASPIK